MTDPEPPVAEPPSGRRYPRTLGGMLYVIILITAAVAIVIVIDHHWRLGVQMLGACLGTAGVLRLLLPQRDAGMLAVRHRLIDVTVLVGLGLALYLLAGSVPAPPS